MNACRYVSADIIRDEMEIKKYLVHPSHTHTHTHKVVESMFDFQFTKNKNHSTFFSESTLISVTEKKKSKHERKINKHSNFFFIISSILLCFICIQMHKQGTFLERKCEKKINNSAK